MAMALVLDYICVGLALNGSARAQRLINARSCRPVQQCLSNIQSFYMFIGNQSLHLLCKTTVRIDGGKFLLIPTKVTHCSGA